MKFDVFLSFRGTDTRRTFVSHLWHALDQKRFRIFKHEVDISENQPASSEVLQAIEESRVAAVIISENYASSVWCLDELEKIIERKEKRSLLVLPIFYGVDHSDVARQADELAKNMIGERDDLEKVKRWSDALSKLSCISGHESRDWGEDSSMIDDIVRKVPPRAPENSTRAFEHANTFETDELIPTNLVTRTIEDARDALRTMSGRYMSKDKPIRVEPRPQLGPSVSSDINSLLGMERHMKAINTLLDLESNDEVREIGIWGAVGVGKTTLARFVYEQISPQFQDHFYFMNDTSRNCRGRSSTCLLENITRDVIIGYDLAMNQSVVKAKLGHQKILLILDGLDYHSQLENITMIARWFGRGSRLIAVDESKDLLISGGVGHLYKVESMRYDEALHLFSLFAFKQEYAPRGFDRLSARAVFYAGHLPLTIKVLGSFLHGKDAKEWEFELRRLEASESTWISAVISSYIGGDFYPRRSTNLDRCIGEEGDGDEFPLYCFAMDD